MRHIGDAEVAISATWAIITLAAIFAGVLVQRFKTQERLRAIEKGIPFPPVAMPPSQNTSREERNARFRVAGIVSLALGLGHLVLFICLAWSVPRFPKGVIGVSAIPLFIGAGFLLEYRLRRAALREDRGN